MQSPSIPSTCEHTFPLGWVLAGLLAGALTACARPGAPEAELLARATAPLEAALAADASNPPEPGSLRVRLAFGAEADLDLFVTDPLAETVYFANTPTRSGGRLLADRRCDAPAPRIESALFAAPLPGRYRVGVDHSEACGGGGEPVVFVLVVEHRGRREQVRGSVSPRQFEPLVLELEIGRRDGGSGSEGNGSSQIE